MREQKFSVPARYQSAFVVLGGGVDVIGVFREFGRHLRPKSSVLIIGVMGGRDYFLFRNLGFTVTAVDLGPQPDISPIIFHNIEERLPFPDESFDVVLISEVLEHLRYDVAALENLRKSLKSDGELFVSVPFFNDHEAGHMRIHSPVSMKRLLEMAGFEIVDFVERPAVVHLGFLNPVLHCLSYLSLLIRGKTGYAGVVDLVEKSSYVLGRLKFLRPLRRLSRRCPGRS